MAVEGALLDGMVCLASCDKTTPGQLMAAARLNIPTLVVICGYQPTGEYQGHHVDIEEVFISAGRVVTGQVSVEQLTGMSDNAIRGPGVCAGMGTANSIHIACECWCSRARKDRRAGRPISIWHGSTAWRRLQ